MASARLSRFAFASLTGVAAASLGKSVYLAHTAQGQSSSDQAPKAHNKQPEKLPDPEAGPTKAPRSQDATEAIPLKRGASKVEGVNKAGDHKAATGHPDAKKEEPAQSDAKLQSSAGSKGDSKLKPTASKTNASSSASTGATLSGRCSWCVSLTRMCAARNLTTAALNEKVASARGQPRASRK